MLLRLIAAIAVLMFATPAFAATVVPVDQAARNSFPNEPGEVVDRVAFINKFVNDAMTYETDQSHYGITDHYVSLPPDGRGDCEDYALSKIELLSNADYPVVTNTRLRFVAVLDGGRLYGHAIAEVRLPNGSIAILDNNHVEPMRRQELERTYQYIFYDW